MNKNKVYGLVSMCCVFFAQLAHSQVREIDRDVAPLTLEAGLTYNDNFNPTFDDSLDAYGAYLDGTGQLVTMQEGSAHVINYYGRYQDMRLEENSLGLPEENAFANYGGAIFSRFYLSDAWTLDTDISHAYQDQMFGTGLSRIRKEIVEKDSVRRNDVSAILIYGRDTYTRFISLKLQLHTDRFEDNNEYSHLFDLTTKRAEFNFSFRRNTISSLLVRLEAVEDDFEAEERRDSTGYRALFGVDYRPNGKSSFEAFIGAYRRTVDGGAPNKGLSWILDYTGTPRQDWLVKINSARYSNASESENAANSIKQNLDLEVKYFYSQQWRHGLEIEHSKVTFNEEAREPDYTEISARIYSRLTLKKHSYLKFEVGLFDTTTSDESRDYKQNKVSLSWQYDF